MWAVRALIAVAIVAAGGPPSRVLRGASQPVLGRAARPPRSVVRAAGGASDRAERDGAAAAGEEAGRTDFFGRARALKPSQADVDESRRHRSVVKIFSVMCRPNYELPWQSHPPESSTGSGLIIREGGSNYVLTNAHVVADSTLIEVRKSGSARRYVARARVVAHECDLALLEIAEPDFWESISPLELGGVPNLREPVVVVGYPEGGDSLCITSGVVSRIELQTYTHSGARLLALQIDAAINPGNSGGPAFDQSGRVVGVAFQNAPDSQSIGYVIPTPVITHFLRDIRLNGGAYLGFPALGIVCQPTENPQLREWLGLPRRGGGLFVRSVHPLARGASAGHLRVDDVLLAVSGVPIASDGTCEVNPQERVSFAHFVHTRFPGEQISMRVRRGGEELELGVPLIRLEKLVPDTVYDTSPSYFVYGGLVFMPLTMGLLHDYGEDWYEEAPRHLVQLWEHGEVERAGQQVVVLSRALAAPETVGYQAFAELRVLAVNAQPVHNFRQFHELMVDACAPGAPSAFTELTLDACGGGQNVVVLKHEHAARVDAQVKRTYRIPALISDDLLAPAPAGAQPGAEPRAAGAQPPPPGASPPARAAANRARGRGGRGVQRGGGTRASPGRGSAVTAIGSAGALRHAAASRHEPAARRQRPCDLSTAWTVGFNGSSRRRTRLNQRRAANAGGNNDDVIGGEDDDESLVSC